MIQLKEIDLKDLSDEVVEFGPIDCMECKFDGHIPKKYYLVEPEVTNEDEYNELCCVVEKHLGYKSFGQVYCEVGF